MKAITISIQKTIISIFQNQHPAPSPASPINPKFSAIFYNKIRNPQNQSKLHSANSPTSQNLTNKAQ